MKVFSLVTLMSLTSSIYALDLAEKDNLQAKQNEVLKPMSNAVKEFVVDRIEFKDKNLQSLSSLSKELKNKSDQQLLEKIQAENGDIRLTPGKFENDTYVVDLGNLKILIETSGFVTGEFKINNNKININDYNSLSEFLGAVEKIGNKELNKTASFAPIIFNLIIPSAHAEIKNGKYIDILKVNSAGVIYLSLNKLALWRSDVEDFKKLLAQISRDVGRANSQCESQSATIGVSGESVKVYGVLNETTRKTLQSIVDRSKGRVTEDRVLAGLFSRYAAKENHGQQAPKNMTCLSFLGPFTKVNVDTKIEIMTNICPDIEKLTSCLNDLYSSDKRVSNVARNEYLLKYSGERFESNTNFLNQINTGISK